MYFLLIFIRKTLTKVTDMKESVSMDKFSLLTCKEKEASSMSDYIIYGGNPDTKKSWISIPDTPEAKAEAIEQGYTHFTTMSFEFPYEKGNAEPNRRGDLWIDFDLKDNPAEAIESARYFISKLEKSYPPFARDMVRYYISGSKGCHLCIPDIIYGDDSGDQLLPEIHRLFIMYLIMEIKKIVPSEPLCPYKYDKIIDTAMYVGGKGHLLREKDILRPNGRYKVEVDCDNFFNLDMQSLLALSEKPGSKEIAVQQPVITEMSNVFNFSKEIVHANASSKKLIHKIFHCQFMQHCFQEQYSLEEPKWMAMLSILSKLGPLGFELACWFSKDHAEFTVSDTRTKLEHAREYNYSCATIREKFGLCPDDCKAIWPDRIAKDEKGHLYAENQFVVKEDGLYMSGDTDDKETKISSYIRILGRCRKIDNTGWGRLIEIRSPDGTIHTEVIPMSLCMGRGEGLLQKLADIGLEIMGPHSCKALLDFLRVFNAPALYTIVDKLGWYNNCFVLPDKVYGDTSESQIKFMGDSHRFRTAGELIDWKNSVGNYVRGNSLLMFLCQFALTGPLLTKCNMESGGFHIYAASSRGKSSSALVAGSVCGGYGRHGFVRQWRASANALEGVAWQHNDGFLALDEIGQATAEMVSQTIYLLMNGSSKQRMKADTTLRGVMDWSISLLSTGELALSQKIEETSKLTTMGGQEVRMISLPALADGDIFSNCHEFDSPGALSENLTAKAKEFYGTVLRAFLGTLFGANEQELEENIKMILGYVNDFMVRYENKNICGQVRRGLRRFALTAAVGRFACKHGILPWTEEEAEDVCHRWANIWIKERGGRMDIEISKAIAKIYEFIEKYGETKFRNLDANGYYGDVYGWTWKSGSDVIYFFKTSRLKEIIKPTNYESVISELINQDKIVKRPNGTILDTKSIDGRNTRGIGIIIKDAVEKNICQISNNVIISKDEIF